MLASVARPDDLDAPANDGFARHAEPVPEFLVASRGVERATRYVVRHEERIATRFDPESDVGDFAKRHEARAEFAHDLEIEIGGADIAAPFAGGVLARFERVGVRTYQPAPFIFRILFGSARCCGC
jgi:hypothetical protein